MTELFAGKPLLRQNGDVVDGGEALAGKFFSRAVFQKVVALYFSAMWCGSCRQFTPKLKRFYEALKKEGKELEIVLVSRDREAEDLLEYLEHGGDWVAIPFGDDRIPEYLKTYEVPTIPALKVIDSSGKLIVDNARKQVEEKGKEDPVALFNEWLDLVKGA